MVDDSFTATFRAKLQSAQADSGLSLSDLADGLGVSPEQMRQLVGGQTEMTVTQLHRYGQMVGRPVYWFFGEQPTGVTIEAAETAVANLARMRLYLDAIETEFRQVLGGAASPSLELAGRTGTPAGRSLGDGSVVVDFAPYLSRARAILEREAEFSEDSEEVFEESVEMIAHSLYSIEMAQSPLRDSVEP